MYLYGEAIQSRIHEVAAAATAFTKGRIRFEELVALPYFGTIILRFDLAEETISLNDLDRWEAMLYDLVGDEFLVDFMGSVYQRAGVRYDSFEQILSRLSVKCQNEPWGVTVHAEGIRKDARELLTIVGLDPELPVWEIQPNADDIRLLIMGEEERSLAQTEGERRIEAEEVRKERCTGLFLAACRAKRIRVSLARLLLEVS